MRIAEPQTLIDELKKRLKEPSNIVIRDYLERCLKAIIKVQNLSAVNNEIPYVLCITL